MAKHKKKILKKKVKYLEELNECLEAKIRTLVFFPHTVTADLIRQDYEMIRKLEETIFNGDLIN